MDYRPLIPPGLFGLGILALIIALPWMQRRGWVDFRRDRVRRGAGHALLGLREFIEPSVEHIFESENRESKEEDDLGADGDDPRAIRDGLAESLGRSTVDPEEVRRHLAGASRAGLDWRVAYEEAVRAELEARPYRAPSIPPPWRVAPRED